MYTIRDYICPKTVKEAYEILTKSKPNTILGGGHFLKLGKKKISKAIDLKDLGLNYINFDDDFVKIGATTTYGQIERNVKLQESFSNIFKKTIEQIVSTQLRNTAQIGASVYARFSFSDILPVLSVLDAKVNLFNDGLIPIDEFIYKKRKKDILTEIIIPRKNQKAVYENIRSNKADFPIINLAMSKTGNNIKTTVGARPQRALYLKEISKSLTEEGFRKEKIEELLKDVGFGKNYKADSDYRRSVCLYLIEKAYGELND